VLDDDWWNTTWRGEFVHILRVVDLQLVESKSGRTALGMLQKHLASLHSEPMGDACDHTYTSESEFLQISFERNHYDFLYTFISHPFNGANLLLSPNLQRASWFLSSSLALPGLEPDIAAPRGTCLF
jgi:hypothetical protein